MRKRGKKIKNNLALKPLGFKNTKYELDAHAALVAIQHNVFNQQHLVDLFVLAEITEKLSEDRHIHAHAASVKNLIELAHQKDNLARLEYAAIEPSANALLECFSAAKNSDIARVCMEAYKK